MGETGLCCHLYGYGKDKKLKIIPCWVVESKERHLQFVLSLPISINTFTFSMNSLFNEFRLSLQVVSVKLFSIEIISDCFCEKFEIFTIGTNTAPRNTFHWNNHRQQNKMGPVLTLTTVLAWLLIAFLFHLLFTATWYCFWGRTEEEQGFSRKRTLSLIG